MSELIFAEDPVLGASSGPLTVDRRALVREAGVRMASQARRELLLFSRALDPDLYDQAPFLSAVQGLALARPGLSVRVLLFDPRSASQGGHRLIELARRLTSRIAIRCVGADDQDRPDAFLIADERGYIHRRLAATMEAVVDFNNPSEARRLRSAFEQIWERSDVAPELSRLYL